MVVPSAPLVLVRLGSWVLPPMSSCIDSCSRLRSRSRSPCRSGRTCRFQDTQEVNESMPSLSSTPAREASEPVATKIAHICSQRWAERGMCAQCCKQGTVYPASQRWVNLSYCRSCWITFLLDESVPKNGLDVQDATYAPLPVPIPFVLGGYTDNLDRVWC